MVEVAPLVRLEDFTLGDQYFWSLQCLSLPIMVYLHVLYAHCRSSSCCTTTTTTSNRDAAGATQMGRESTTMSTSAQTVSTSPLLDYLTADNHWRRCHFFLAGIEGLLLHIFRGMIWWTYAETMHAARFAFGIAEEMHPTVSSASDTVFVCLVIAVVGFTVAVCHLALRWLWTTTTQH